MKHLAILILVLCAGFAYATPIHYLEEFDGDLAGNDEYGPLTSLRLGEGLNTIGGYWGNYSDFDSFRFIVPRGIVVDRISLMFLSLDQTHADWMTCFRIGDVFQDVFRGDNSPFSAASVVSMFNVLLPLRSGRYRMDQAYFSGSEGSMDALYVWSMEARAVPATGALSFMLVALALIAARRRLAAP